jgi:hypothetical protein
LKRPRSFWVAGLAGLLLGVVLGFLAGTVRLAHLVRPGYEVPAALPWSGASNDVSEETQVLRALRTGDTAGATELLEQHLDEHLYMLGTYDTDVPANLHSAATYRVLQRAAEYRAAYPRAPSTTSDGQKADAVIFRALAIGREHVPAP